MDQPGGNEDTDAVRDRLSRLSEASLRINESLDPDTVLQEVMDTPAPRPAPASAPSRPSTTRGAGLPVDVGGPFAFQPLRSQPIHRRAAFLDFLYRGGAVDSGPVSESPSGGSGVSRRTPSAGRCSPFARRKVVRPCQSGFQSAR